MSRGLVPRATKRLRFRRFRNEDAAWIASYWESAAYRMELREERPASVEGVRSLMQRRAAAGDLDFLFEQDRSGRRVGRASIQRLRDKTAEIEIEIPDRDLRRQGYGSEALASLEDFAHRQLRVTRLTARIASGNEASVALAGKQGFRLWRKALAVPGGSPVLTFVHDMTPATTHD